ncbi:MAG: lipopolysaccharide biosynthesis protein [Chloroflexi bacterium]|jgi:O-antigen/teichoic acid export membrane protein|nr:lipopolysaccharide biosynthesis protein [Chloroflexota bacterium]
MDAKTNFAAETLRGTFWTYAAYLSGKVLVFISTVILARLLTKDDFGVVGYALVTISLLDVLSDLGVGPALIYERENPKTADTAFWLGLLVSTGLFFLAWLIAPLAGLYFNDERAIPVIRVLALTFPISALSNIHDSLLRKNLAFKNRFVPDFARSVSKGVFSILFAVLGFGAWSLIFGQLAGTLTTVLAYWKVLPWRPSFNFIRKTANSLLSYGINIVSVDALATLLLNVDYLFVGRFMGATALGVYSLAFRIPDLLITQFCNVISKVVFPVYVRMRDESHNLTHGFLMTLQYVSIVTVPLSIGLALVSKPFVLTFLTQKWNDAISVMQAISIYALLFSLSYNAGSLYKAQGHPETLTRLALLRLAILVPALYWATTRFGTITAVGWTHAAVALLVGAINLYVAGRMINVPFKTILGALRPAFVSGLLMALVVLWVLNITASITSLMQLLVATTMGALVYIAALMLQIQNLFREVRQIFRAAVRGES